MKRNANEGLEPQRLTAMDSQVFLQMVLILEGLATLGALELTVARSLGQHLVLGELRRQHEFYANIWLRVCA